MNDGNTEGLFRAAFMQSGSPPHSADITNGQHFFDMFVSNTSCKGARDVIDCLRSIPEAEFQAAVDSTPSLTSNTVSSSNPFSKGARLLYFPSR
jgi:acetylcholinesterase